MLDIGECNFLHHLRVLRHLHVWSKLLTMLVKNLLSSKFWCVKSICFVTFDTITIWTLCIPYLFLVLVFSSALKNQGSSCEKPGIHIAIHPIYNHRRKQCGCHTTCSASYHNICKKFANQKIYHKSTKERFSQDLGPPKLILRNFSTISPYNLERPSIQIFSEFFSVKISST